MVGRTAPGTLHPRALALLLQSHDIQGKEIIYEDSIHSTVRVHVSWELLECSSCCMVAQRQTGISKQRVAK